MGAIEKKIANDLKDAIKKRNKISTSTLRMLTAAIQNLAIEKRPDEVDDEDVLKIIAKHLKQHQDSIESFKKGKRYDLVEQESKELEILKSFLPEQLDEKEIEEIVKKAISETQAGSKADFGKVMKLSMQELKGKAEGKLVSSIVLKLLTPKE